MQAPELNTLQNDKIANIFDEWLNDGWKSNSITASPQHENLMDLNRTTPDWLEWDPLSASSTSKGKNSWNLQASSKLFRVNIGIDSISGSQQY